MHASPVPSLAEDLQLVRNVCMHYCLVNWRSCSISVENKMTSMRSVYA